MNGAVRVYLRNYKYLPRLDEVYRGCCVGYWLYRVLYYKCKEVLLGRMFLIELFDKHVRKFNVEPVDEAVLMDRKIVDAWNEMRREYVSCREKHLWFKNYRKIYNGEYLPKFVQNWQKKQQELYDCGRMKSCYVENWEKLMAIVRDRQANVEIINGVNFSELQKMISGLGK